MLGDNLIENHFDETMNGRSSLDLTQVKVSGDVIVRTDDDWDMVDNNQSQDSTQQQLPSEKRRPLKEFFQKNRLSSNRGKNKNQQVDHYIISFNNIFAQMRPVLLPKHR